MIQVENLTKKFEGFTAIDNISFEIKPGEIIGLLGPNGAGKTTTLRILTSYFNPSLGKIKYDELDIIDNTIKIQQKIGYLPENNPLYEEMKVKEYLNYAGQMHDIPKTELKEKVNKATEICDLKSKQNQVIGKLSKGFKQRVGLAQALIHDPEILILDEPTEGLDPNQRIEIRDLIKKIGQAKTVILSSHVLSEVEATCDRVLIINQGKIIASGTPDELKKQATSQTKIFIKIEGPLEKINETLKKTEGVERIISAKKEANLVDIVLETDSTLDLRKKLVHLIINNGWELYEISRQEKSLEDIFVNLTKKI
ncbi:MAG: ATP-binding cassette domain-containing protein [Candidatus Buchananbacteria bacterium]|nr:ATP-binding cassette domain-containing protein [Candidatus Buchananbacteria bacterium]